MAQLAGLNRGNLGEPGRSVQCAAMQHGRVGAGVWECSTLGRSRCAAMRRAWAQQVCGNAARVSVAGVRQCGALGRSRCAAMQSLKRSVQGDLAVSTLAHDVFVSVVSVRSFSGPCKASFVLKRAFWDHHEVVLIFRVEPGHRRTQQNRVISFLMPID